MSKRIKLVFVGKEGEHILGYPAKDIVVSEKEAEKLIKTGLYNKKIILNKPSK